MRQQSSFTCRLLVAAALMAWSVGHAVAAKPAPRQFDVVVYGGTPGGIAAAVAAARLGRTVALAEYHPHLGGMAASGLGKSDIENREAIGGLFREFVQRVYQHYVRAYGAGHENIKLCRDGYYYEPSVAEHVFGALVAEEPRIHLFLGHRLEGVERFGSRVMAIQLTDRATRKRLEVRGLVFIDATYEGDLAAYAGADYRLGRESRAEFNELHAGVVYMDYETRVFLSGTTGEGDRRLPAYTFRLCLTDDPANSHVLHRPPPEYDRTRYLGYLDDWREGRMGPPRQMKDGMGYYSPTFNTVVRALSLAPIPNRKFDVNMNPRPLGFPFCEENGPYPEGDWATREAVTTRIRNLTLGLLYFLQNDEAIPAEQRQLARRYHLARDEFVDHGHFPWQLYVREARRIIGEYTLSENDLIVGPGLGRPRIHGDSVAAGEYPIDSFPVRKREPGHDVALEGYILMLDEYTHPYQIPYRIMVPRRVDGLLVPVAASTTHIAYSSIRLEPTWMALGQAAGTAAHLALERCVPVRQVPVAALQRELLRQGQVLTHFTDIDRQDPAYAGLQFFAARGFFPDYEARSMDPLDRATARQWFAIALGDRAASMNDVLAGDGYVQRSSLASLFPGRLPAGSETSANRQAPIARGEFCRLLYETRLPDAE
ncbi:MAG TPA: FAD-dependent oxidoreductase [Candidatus Paceibacterota bacterium]|nr:FAD-dependent oxidoreductase [Verrucomicrobiota bacterium]HRZ45011.1 FAD-dependent oxidoreductase [Candidatus Paceibacterota bacterium]